MFLESDGFLAVHISLQIEVVFYCEYVLFDFTDFFFQNSIPFLWDLFVICDLFSSLPNILVEVGNHAFNVFTQTIDIVVLNFHLTSNSLFERGYVFEDFAALFHPQIQNFELIFDVLVFLFDLSAQLLNEFGMLHELFVHTGKHSPLKYFRVVGYHERDFFDSELVFGLVSLEFVNKGWWLEYPFLDWAKNFLNYLSYFGFHLEPFELFNFEL